MGIHRKFNGKLNLKETNLMSSPSDSLEAKDLDLLKLFRKEQENFRNHLALKEEEIMNLKSLLNRNCSSQETQTEAKQGDFDEIFDKLDINGLGKDGVKLKIINEVMSVDSDSVPFFESVQQFKDWISNLQGRADDHSVYTHSNHQSDFQSSHQSENKSQGQSPGRNAIINSSNSEESQTDKILAYSLLSLFAKDLKNTVAKKSPKTQTSQKVLDLNDKYQSTLKYLNYQMQVNADMKKLLVDTVVGSQMSKSYSFWGSDPEIQKNILDLYNDSLVKIGKLNFIIDSLEAQNFQLNQILEEFLMATID